MCRIHWAKWPVLAWKNPWADLTDSWEKFEVHTTKSNQLKWTSAFSSSVGDSTGICFVGWFPLSFHVGACLKLVSNFSTWQCCPTLQRKRENSSKLTNRWLRKSTIFDVDRPTQYYNYHQLLVLLLYHTWWEGGGPATRYHILSIYMLWIND